MHALAIAIFLGGAFASPLVVSLGSSYAFGYGLDVPIGGHLRQSLTRSTGQQWRFDNIAVSGSVLKDISKFQAPKLKGLSPDVIYMLSGGNDINYVECLSSPADPVCAHPESQTAWQSNFEAALDAVFSYVDNPKQTSLFVVTYPVAIGPDTKCGKGNTQCPISSDQQIDQISKLYNDQVDWTVTGLKDWQSKFDNKNLHTTLIPMRQHSQGHEVGSASPWVNGADVKNGSWHPNAAGAQNIAEFILQARGKL